MVAIAPFSSPVADISIGILCSGIGLILLLRYLLYLYTMLVFNEKKIECNNIENRRGYFFANNKKVFPTIYSAFYNDKKNIATKNIYLIMRSRATQKTLIEMVSMGNFYVIKKGSIKIYPVPHILLNLSISAYAFYSFYN